LDPRPSAEILDPCEYARPRLENSLHGSKGQMYSPMQADCRGNTISDRLRIEI